MAIMVPDINPALIKNDGERAFYTAASKLSNDYYVFYSFKYIEDGEIEGAPNVREADFVIVSPRLGFVAVEVKQGEISYQNGVWYEYKDEDPQRMHNNPLEQAKNAMYSIKSLYFQRTKGRFPLSIRYALAFPESLRIDGILPADLNDNSVFLYDDMEDLEPKLIELFGGKHNPADIKVVRILVDKILNPRFNTIARLEEEIDMFNNNAERIFTEEQERILEETELDKRKIFFGAAGTGKTYIAMEKARRLASQGKRVLLTCFNKNLANWEFNKVDGVEACNFHEYIAKALRDKGIEVNEPDDSQDKDSFFKLDLPTMAFEYFSEADNKERFDSIIVDEGQDFRDEWITCLEAMLKKDGEFYIFADPNQNLFGCNIGNIRNLNCSSQKLTRNLRNSIAINEWIKQLKPDIRVKSFIRGGMGVKYFSFKSTDEEKRMIAEEIGRLISQGIKPQRITILSPHRQEGSCLAGMDRIKSWTIDKVGSPYRGGIKFETIRSFKGLESDIVFLIGIRKESRVCTATDVYVGGSRARFLLYIFHEEGWNINDVKPKCVE